MADAAAQKKKSGNKITRYFREVKSELKKVVWPSKKQIINNTLIVIASVIIVGVIIWVFDAAFGWGLNKLITK